MKSSENKAADIIVPEQKCPIVFVPDPSYVDADGNLIPTNVKVCASPELYEKVVEVLEVLNSGLTEVKEVPEDDGSK